MSSRYWRWQRYWQSSRLRGYHQLSHRARTVCSNLTLEKRWWSRQYPEKRPGRQPRREIGQLNNTMMFRPTVLVQHRCIGLTRTAPLLTSALVPRSEIHQTPRTRVCFDFQAGKNNTDFYVLSVVPNFRGAQSKSAQAEAAQDACFTARCHWNWIPDIHFALLVS